MRNTWLMAFSAAASLVWLPTASAGYVQLTQTRAMTTNASASAGASTPRDDADGENSDALGAFDRTVTSGAGASDLQFPYFASASGAAEARQSVHFSPTSFSGSFVADTRASSTLASGSAGATSAWSTTFRVDQPTPFDLDGRLRAENISNVVGFTGGTNNASVSLRRQAEGGGAEETLYTVSLTLAPAPLFSVERAVDFNGVLEPGYVYGLLATAEGSRFSSSRPVEVPISGVTTTDVTFTLTMLPEPSAAAVAGSAAFAAALLRRRWPN